MLRIDSDAMASNESDSPTGEVMKPANVLYPPSLLRRAELARKWKGLRKGEFFRMALETATRQIEHERLKSERELGA